MRRVGLTGALLAAGVLSGCASQGLLSGDTPGLSESFIVTADFQAAYRRAGEYVRVCHEQRPHPYGVVYQSSRRLGDRGAPNEVHVFKREEPTKILEIIQSQTETPSTARVTVRVLGDGKWDAAEIAAAKASIQSATPVCRQGGD
ncbi:BPTD_2524 family lipoprotein [Bordetella bronchiseptica]|uniref:Lipoprotein n=3 Tax=Bordetella bronchiseptica TaxID=518 RepID=A0A0H3LME4_BORBR|nr:lipoprotein [Bordetella bronchiseptica]KAK68102.1 putative lipoprotein [Bordetella bronchiseptica 980-2]AMG88388.1 lipoprotein [Bordetella bronchiseptica]AWP75850.1 lipoprotein [Bordetella bronchiseptica]AWP80624.1 lipoprotein [Bordetella bronchiseptica]AWP85425.1 lipoprotein [Bordetella bronchiseptica]